MATLLTAVAAANVRAEAARQRLRQHDLAAALGLSQAAVSARMCGHTPFTLPDLERLAALLGVPVADLLAPREPLGESA